MVSTVHYACALGFSSELKKWVETVGVPGFRFVNKHVPDGGDVKYGIDDAKSRATFWDSFSRKTDSQNCLFKEYPLDIHFTFSTLL